MARLEQILVLRRLQLPIKDIRAILTSQDLAVAVAAVARKLRGIEADMQQLAELRRLVEAFLTRLRERGFAPLPADAVGLRELAGVQEQAHGSDKEANPMSEGTTAELTGVRIIELKPVQVAYHRAEGASPESDAWNHMLAWVRQHGLDELPATRYFGFDNPGPRPGTPVYGYEVWVTLPPGFAASGMPVKDFPGGLYAVIPAYVYEISERWRMLVRWAKHHPAWGMTAAQCLEETISPDKTPSEQSQLDLFLPIRRK